MLAGGLGVAIYTPAFLLAVDRTGVAVGTVVAIGFGPFFAGAMEWGWRGVQPSRGWFLGTVVTVAGGVLLVLSQSADSSPPTQSMASDCSSRSRPERDTRSTR